MSPGVESGVFAIIGAAVGALGAALTGITQAVISGRARRAELKAEAAAARAATRRPLYEQLIGITHSVRRDFVKWRQPASSDPNVTGWDEVARVDVDMIETAVRPVRIDGSARANQIAAQLLANLEAWQDLPDRYTFKELTGIIEKLDQAEDDLTTLARQETGA
jgi:hypothetical protein